MASQVALLDAQIAMIGVQISSMRQRMRCINTGAEYYHLRDESQRLSDLQVNLMYQRAAASRQARSEKGL